ncbi:sensor histidine kinase [Frondihabitans sucicola]|uniref:sensor histidine kinase n=1 Tax=Frondihabitans sucicola TaxID=1268041 RepID=UPI0025742411|nr:histidine kinase [Frondihabitans sucicola]
MSSLRLVVSGFVRSVTLVVLTWFVPALLLVAVVFCFRVADDVVLAWWWVFWLVALILLIFARLVSRATRILVARWTGTEVAPAYRPVVPLTRLTTGYWWNGYGYQRRRWQAAYQRWLRTRVRDPAAWRDMLWIVVAPLSVGIAAALPLALIAFGALAALRLGVVSTPFLAVLSIVVGVALLPAGWRLVEPVAVRLLGPSLVELLSTRVATLVVARGDLTQAQDAELHRIERDLHDGAQARLVAIGLSVGAAERLIDSDPEEAKSLLRQTREASSLALRELRELVRGIVPPVLSERGLVEAVRALALDSPVPTRVGSDLAGRLELPIEAALYFATAELVTNAAKHSGADAVDIRIAPTATGVAVVVADDGRGGADEAAGSGLPGVRDRLAAFDGTLLVESPAGGPTRITLEVPCASS